MSDAAKKVEKDVKKKTKLKVIEGGKAKVPTAAKKAKMPKTKKVKEIKAKKPKTSASKKKKWVGKEGEWRSVLRLPTKLAARLQKAANKNNLSINEALKTVIEVWAKQEKC